MKCSNSFCSDVRFKISFSTIDIKHERLLTPKVTGLKVSLRQDHNPVETCINMIGWK
jgi:hypothetical protein